MNKLFVLALSFTFLVSCGDKEEPKDEYLVLSGKVENFRKRKIEITNDYNGFKKDISFDRKSKTFSDTLRNFEAGHYSIKVGRRNVNLYLSTAKDLQESLEIIVDAKKRTEDPVFKGKNAAINAYLAEREKKAALLLGNIRKLYALNEDEFLSKMDEFKSNLEDLAASSNLPADYLANEKNNIHYQFALGIKNYQNFHRIVYGDDDFVVSDNFPNDIPNKVSFDSNSDYAFSNWYRDLIKRRLDDKTNAKKKENEDFDFDLAYLETVQTEVNDTLVKNHLIHSAATESITYTSNLNEYFKKYMNYSTNKENKKEIQDLYNKLKLTAKGQPSPKFEKLDNYKGGKTSLDDLTGKGKYIYIDVWATWCGFCKKEIPLLKRFEQQFHDKNIEFVSLSVDKPVNKEKWKKTIVDREMGGVQLFAGKTEKDFQFTKDYLIKGLPRFILIDPDGNIVSANAPRPSDGDKLVTLLEELLEEGEHSM
ncbi:TlpA family protein disulfide reductase [Tenacibaculum sp. M341]|uniref:TlpA family protein disulfide reductase n=1 Tax=Tenacibaculum sp. M341 TaxID=2530339 RepID=UPI0010429D81|nr:TlpA disulfide reductase family protein [Tenacibaculum sp. M341]TCI92653.1 TlpA family protein disulfide reductase [Tenacibaculum sp. M341]